MLAEEVTLRDGNPYLLRPLTLADVETLQAFFYSHSEETIRYRYGYNIRRMSSERAKELCGVDQSVDPALGVFGNSSDDTLLHAVGRYFLDADKSGGEMAFVVRESKRRIGMARLLLETLMQIAGERGLTRLWAQVERDNLAMLSLFQSHGAYTRAGEDINSLFVEIPIGKK